MIQVRRFTYKNETYVALFESEICDWREHQTKITHHPEIDYSDIGVVVLPENLYQSMRTAAVDYATSDNVIDMIRYNSVLSSVYAELLGLRMMSAIQIDPDPKFAISDDPNRISTLLDNSPYPSEAYVRDDHIYHNVHADPDDTPEDK